MKAYHIAIPEQFFHNNILNPLVPSPLFIGKGIRCNNVHAKTSEDLCRYTADLSRTNNTSGLSVKVKTY